MPKYEWIEMTDVLDTITLLSDKYPDRFGHIVIDRIKFVGILESPPPKAGSKIWNLTSIKDPMNDLLNVDIVGLIHFDSWANLDDKSRTIVVASMLSCIEWNERLTIKGCDLVDSKSMVINFGVDYEINPDTPDILNTHYNWRTS
jgi:hypothetical protein